MEIIMMNDEEEIDWLDLSFDLLAQITEKVISFSLTDYVRFCCICVQWRSFLIENYGQIKLSSLPLLLIPSLNHPLHSSYNKQKVEDDNESNMSNYYNPKDIWQGLDYEQRHKSTRSFYSLFDGKVYDFQLPIPSYMNLRGSSHGWLLLVEECRSDGTFPVHLFNPFRSDQKNNKIQLPPLSTFTSSVPFYSCNLMKAFFSRDPSSYTTTTTTTTTTTSTNDDDKLVVLGYYLGIMVFCRPDDGAWTPMPTPGHSPTLDVIFYKGQFWGILQNGSAVVFDIAPEPKFTIVVDPYPEDHTYPCKRYLVESAGGDLFHVRRDFDLPDDDDVNYSTEGFLVFKLEPMTMQWVKTNTLDGCMFFLGDNTSKSLSVAENYPRWCKPNSIYFTDDYLLGHICYPWKGPSDIGVFNLEAGTFEPLYTMDSKPIMPAPPIMPPPIWIQPNL